jgi:hypothetical protein
MADGLLSSILGVIDRQKQATKAGLGLLVSDPIEFARNATARYFPAPEEAAQQRALEQSGGIAMNTPYMDKMFNLAQFQGSIKPMKVFHGGASPIFSPNLSKSGSVSKIPEEGRAFWVTPSESSAKQFGEMASKTPVISEFFYVPKNPLVVEYPVRSIFDNTFGKLKIDSLNKARKSGYDSVIFRQAGNGEKLLADEIAILDTVTIKTGKAKTGLLGK